MTEILPKLVDIGGTRKTPSQPHYGNLFDIHILT